MFTKQEQEEAINNMTECLNETGAEFRTIILITVKDVNPEDENPEDESVVCLRTQVLGSVIDGLRAFEYGKKDYLKNNLEELTKAIED
jgi:hypothetical protein